ncbi:SPOR domain-containing protein [Glaciimonas sp. Cout2]|uniref:SPOR domain-containing protein n=1 Tax=Glaciimonas sp. Cout2 TaxID=3048621 RepID=UPI002B2307F1|nr:SPOR domain-containing protein [Glaciimonas sp. Cout2]MEB0010836.1 SPOR domain-containing protein [Glaciimonas sp. Cout2]
MLKIFFWLLLLINAGLFALQHGYVEGIGLISNGREPARLTNQLQADKIKLVPVTEAEGEKGNSARTNQNGVTNSNSANNANNAAITSTANPGGGEKDGTDSAANSAFACTEVGNFSAAEARRFASQLAEVAPTVQPIRRPVQEIASYRVYLPSFGSQDAANKKGEELLGLGITDFFVIQDAPPLLYGISLGTFKSEEASQIQVARLEEKGLIGIRVEARKATAGKVAIQLRLLNAQTSAQLTKVVATFTHKEVRSCDEATLPERS